MNETQGTHDALSWFMEFQCEYVTQNGIFPEWFHGIISRKVAEERLLRMSVGNFLIRVSESRIGYTLSYCGSDRCRHFMIDVLKDNHYVLVGEETSHKSLQHLVNFHHKVPIMPFNETLTVACGQESNEAPNYAKLFVNKRQPMTPNHDLWPNNPPNTNSFTSLELDDRPPALPQRTRTLIDPVGRSTSKPPPTPNSPTPRLYPCLETMVAAQPVPFARKMHTANKAQPDNRPELPLRSPVKPPRRNKDQGATTPESLPASRSLFPDKPQTRPNPAHKVPNATKQRSQDVKPASCSLSNFRKKFIRAKSVSQEHMYAEINITEADRVKERERDTAVENEYQTLPGDINNINQPISPKENRFPPEYQAPPPFAPGY
ncbi:hypothetical protein DPEC_G00269290 [Dallia pectoralis]|uniref:Uncharacterized protein n=1 Tax=Dallia pectoralis TaxID=75939 RepID=A0ACC2FPD2_DALPE|nr:hypothetical protein DPEC_G00269290 [Dallia pectoralis]